MIALTFGLIGGIGLFLLGMSLLTDGLKSFAGDNLRIALIRFTDRPAKAFASGALVTALVQSSSATTVTVIGFVSAGLLTFSAAVSVVMGASLGTTATGWLVSVLGLKVSIGFYALPVIGMGAFFRLLGRGRWRELGLALAGFGIIFIGIETLQQAMEGLSGVFRLSEMPAAGFWGHALAMLIGLVMTVVMQSSSAAVATTLTALHTGSIAFDQAASLVIGAAIGTTVTGALAAIGGSVPAKRTALAHVLFNTATGLIAIILLPLFLYLINLAQLHMGLDPGAVSLAAFHTLFITVGVLVFLPFVDRFAHRVEKFLPEHAGVLTRNLDASLLSIPAVALETARQTFDNIASEMSQVVQQIVAQPHDKPLDEKRIENVLKELNIARVFFAKIPPITGEAPLSDLRISLIHAVDHLLRMEEYLRPSPVIRQALSHAQLQATLQRGMEVIDFADQALQDNIQPGWQEKLSQDAHEFIAYGEEQRALTIGAAANGYIDSADATHNLDTIRWTIRVANHLSRIALYLHPAAKH